MIKAVILFVIGLVLLIKAGDWFVDGATGIAKRFNLPDIVVGATVVSIGTTLPEVMVSTTGAIQGLSSMAYGNAIGSIICNTALIAAISIAFNPGPVNTKSMKMPVLFFFGSALIYCISAYILGEFPRYIGVIMLVICFTYLWLTVREGMRNPDSIEEEDDEEESKEHALWLDIVLLIVGAALIALGANLLVDNGTIIAHEVGVPETVIALTFVALGTSLPELVTTITSLKKGHAHLGIGNVIGANVFNLVMVSGVAVTIAPFKVPVGKLLAGHNASLVLEIPVMLAVMLLMCCPALASKKLARWQGILLLAIYVAFLAFQFAF